MPWHIHVTTFHMKELAESASLKSGSDALSQGYTNLQSLVKCLIIGVLHQIQHAVKQGCAGLRNALKCISEAMFTVTESSVFAD